MGTGTEGVRYIPVALARFDVQVAWCGVSLASGDVVPCVQLSQQAARDCSTKRLVQVPQDMCYGTRQHPLIIHVFYMLSIL